MHSETHGFINSWYGKSDDYIPPFWGMEVDSLLRITLCFFAMVVGRGRTWIKGTMPVITGMFASHSCAAVCIFFHRTFSINSDKFPKLSLHKPFELMMLNSIIYIYIIMLKWVKCFCLWWWKKSWSSSQENALLILTLQKLECYLKEWLKLLSSQLLAIQNERRYSRLSCEVGS